MKRKFGSGAIVRCSENLAQEGNKVAVWNVRPFQLVSLLEMIEFRALDFIRLAQFLKFVQTVIEDARRVAPNSDEIVEDSTKSLLEEKFVSMIEVCKTIGLELSVMLIEDINSSVKNTSDYKLSDLGSDLRELERRVDHEMSLHMFMVIPRNKLDYFKNQNLFGQDVANKFSDINDDVEKAGRCFATGNYTATVFHLMRVMERGVQYLGAKLGVKLAHEKEWQTILNEVNTAIKALSHPPTKMTTQLKEERDKYAAASERLQNVKDAWRNKVMHPKASYDETEAEEVFTATKRFIQHLEKIA